jgi:hypothetical protein
MNKANGGRATPLCVAAKEYHPALCDLVLGHGANPKAADCDELSPLCFPEQRSELDVAQPLLAHGADVKRANAGG